MDRTAGWHHYEATFTDTDVTITLDLESDGTVDSTLTFSGSPSANPFVDLRFGGPSGITSAGPMWVDNIMLSQIPEPSVAMLGLLGGFGCWPCSGAAVNRPNASFTKPSARTAFLLAGSRGETAGNIQMAEFKKFTNFH